MYVAEKKRKGTENKLNLKELKKEIMQRLAYCFQSFFILVVGRERGYGYEGSHSCILSKEMKGGRGG